MYVVAHQDDDILFQSPGLLRTIASGRCVRTVFVTAGDDGKSRSYWEGREAGAQAAYAQLAGVADAWEEATLDANGHTLALKTLTAQPRVSLVFMRLPDGGLTGGGFASHGNQSLRKLWTSAHPCTGCAEETASTPSTAPTPTDTATSSARSPRWSTASNRASWRRRTTPRNSANPSKPGSTTRTTSRPASSCAKRRNPMARPTACGASSATRSNRNRSTSAVNCSPPRASPSTPTANTTKPTCESAATCEGTHYEQSWLKRQYVAATETKGAVADAGFAQTVAAEAEVTLDGLEKSSESGGSLAYEWTQTRGPSVSLSGANTATPTFTMVSHPTLLTFSLVVRDGLIHSAPDYVDVRVPSSTSKPTAVAGPEQTVASGASVQLDGSGSWDPNSEPLTYAWTQTSGPEVTLSGASTAEPTFTAPYGPTTLAFSLVVDNGTEESGPDSVTVEVEGIKPSFASAASTTFTTGVAGSFTIATAGSPAATIAKTAGSLPTGVTLVDQGDGTAKLSGTPAKSAAPPLGESGYPITLKASNSEGNATQSFTLTVENPGVAPSFTSAASTTFTTGVAGSFTVTTGGEPAPALSREGALPAGLAFTDNGDGTATIAGTPAKSAAPPAGESGYPLTLKAASGAGNATQSFTLTVENPGVAPSFTSAASTAFTTGVAGSLTIATAGSPAATIAKTAGPCRPGSPWSTRVTGPRSYRGRPPNGQLPRRANPATRSP